MWEMVHNQHRYFNWDRYFLENSPVIAGLTTSPAEVYQRILVIESVAGSSSETFEDLKELCYQLVCRVPIPLIEIDTTFLIRCRPGFALDGKVYSHVGELSYNPNLSAVLKGRFNLDSEPIFYACVPSYAPQGSTALAAILESCKNVIAPFPLSSHSYATVSRWDLQKRFMVMNISMYDKAAEKNLSVHRINSHYIKLLQKRFTPESLQAMFLLYRYLSEKAGSIKKGESDYLVTTAFKHAVSKYYGASVMGTLYSSAMSENHCLNVALNREVIDHGYLNLHGAIIYKIINHPYLPERMIYPCSDYARSDEYGNFRFRISPIDENSKYQ